ncbi:MAG: hypothetical protein ABI462_11395 [Ignavibacteria bacterium]
MQKTKFALLVNGGYNFSGHSFEAVVFGLKYHLTNRSALRLNIGYSFSGNRYGGKHHHGDTIGSMDNFRHEGHSGNNEKYFASVQYMFYPKPMKIINTFFGLGPRFGFGSSHSMHPENPEELMGDEHRHGNRPWSIGLSGVFGAEWFATKSLSLSAEYAAAYSYQEMDDHHPDQNEIDHNGPHGNETSKFRFTDLSARIGLSLYFDNPF